MGATNGVDPDGRYARRIALLAKVTELDTEITAFKANTKNISDVNGLRDLSAHQIELQRQAALLPST